MNRRHFYPLFLVIILAIALVAKPSPLLATTKEKSPEPEVAAPKPPADNILEFEWNRQVSAAVFTRSNMLWVIFDQAKAFDTKTLLEAGGGIIQSIELIPNRYYTIIRFEMDKPRAVSAQQFGLNWGVRLAKDPRRTLQAIQAESVNVPPAPPHVYIGVNQSDVKPVRITDPVVGDEMIVIPLSRVNFGIPQARRYVDFQMLETAQGVALQLFTDSIKLYPTASAINLVTPSMELNNTMPRDVKEKVVVTNNKILPSSLLPFNEWAKDDPATFGGDLSSLQKAVTDASPNEQSKQRLRLARFYLFHDFASEAWGVFNLIRETDKAFAESTDVKLANGVAAFAMRKYLEAQKIFSSIPALEKPEQEAEVDFWRLVVKSKLDPRAKVPPFFLEHKDGFVARYPLWLQRELALTAAEQHITSDDLEVAGQMLQVLDSVNPDGKITNDITYLKGLFAAHHDQAPKAITLWDGLTKDALDRYNRTRAQMALVELLLAEKKIDIQEAIKRLNTIRLAWRGDELERNILKILGQLYIDAGDYKEGLRVWRGVVTNFPNTPDALYVATKMTQTFIYLFNQGGADKLSPLDALALYYEFKELTPIGEQGDMMVQRVANRLFQMDLLNEASILLTHQVRYRLKGEEKIRLGKRLAMLHLWNKRPSLALEVLDVLDAEGEFPGLAVTRYHLRAQALSDLGRYDEALKLLENDYSVDARSIKMGVYWKTKRWDGVSLMLSPEFRRLSYKERALTASETGDLLLLATVYSIQKKKYALNKLYTDFKGRIPSDQVNEQKTFDFIAGNLDAVDYKDIKGTMQVQPYQSFLEKYRNYAKDHGLGEVEKASAEGEAKPDPVGAGG